MNTQTQKSFKFSQLRSNPRAFNEKRNKDDKKEHQLLFSSGGRLRGEAERRAPPQHGGPLAARGRCYGNCVRPRTWPAGKMAAPVSLCHVACCANRVGGGAVSWGRRGLLAFGSCRDVVLYQPAVSGWGWAEWGWAVWEARWAEARCFLPPRRRGGRSPPSVGTPGGWTACDGSAGEVEVSGSGSPGEAALSFPLPESHTSALELSYMIPLVSVTLCFNGNFGSSSWVWRCAGCNHCHWCVGLASVT